MMLARQPRSFGLRFVESIPQWVRVSEPSCRLNIKVVPGASRDAIVGEHGDAIRVKLQAPPVDGRANTALLEFLASRLGLRSSALHLVAGATGRHKVVAITGFAAGDARRRLLTPA